VDGASLAPVWRASASRRAVGRLSDMQKSPQLWKLYSIFWSLYGRCAWDDQREPARVSDPPERIVEIVQNRRIKPHEWILDAGCGTGNYTIALAKAGFHVIGADFAAGMLAKAQEKVTGDLSKNVSLQRVDLNVPLNFPKDYFDHIISMSVLQAVVHPNFTLNELYRVLKPGGTIVLSLPKEDSKVLSQSLSELIKYRIRHLERRTPGKMLLVVLKCFGDRFHHSPRWTVARAQSMLNAMGFETISLEEGRQILVVAEKR
jgi:ubiquinone/menaquinone biosynthesis C-methylase UbiE